MGICFVGLRDKGKKTYLYKDPQCSKKEELRQVLWGDQLQIEKPKPGENVPKHVLKVIWAPNSPEGKKQEAFIKKDHTTPHRPLEIIFVDVGQGDGCVLIAPGQGKKERVIVIDAGPKDHMKKFLEERFGSYSNFDFEAAVLTHCDMDHYKGFEEIFKDANIGFNTIFHNGLLERADGDKIYRLGDLTNCKKYLKNFTETESQVEKYFSDSSKFGKKKFPPVMHAALSNPKIKHFKMLSTQHGTKAGNRRYMPGFEPSDKNNYATIEVLGPVVEFSGQNKDEKLLRKIGKYGETKNGHSVLLRLKVGDFSVFFGGDLNKKAEKFLLKHYAEIEKFPKKGTKSYCEMVEKAAGYFRSDVMKVCHHGSSKVTDAFLQAVHPASFIISSGDREGNMHPRPDLLGRLGRHGRGDAPVLLLTELQRSTREFENLDLEKKLLANIKKLADPTGKISEKSKKNLLKKLKSSVKELTRPNVDVYGSIYVKTDGKRLITACKIENQSADAKNKWFYFHYEVEQKNGSKDLKLKHTVA